MSSVFSCVQTTVWLPVFGISNVHTGADACDYTRGMCVCPHRGLEPESVSPPPPPPPPPHHTPYPPSRQRAKQKQTEKASQKNERKRESKRKNERKTKERNYKKESRKKEQKLERKKIDRKKERGRESSKTIFFLRETDRQNSKLENLILQGL